MRTLSSKKTEPIVTKICMGDYVGDPYLYAKFQHDPNTPFCPPNMRIFASTYSASFVGGVRVLPTAFCQDLCTNFYDQYVKCVEWSCMTMLGLSGGSTWHLCPFAKLLYVAYTLRELQCRHFTFAGISHSQSLSIDNYCRTYRPAERWAHYR